MFKIPDKVSVSKVFQKCLIDCETHFYKDGRYQYKEWVDFIVTVLVNADYDWDAYEILNKHIKWINDQFHDEIITESIFFNIVPAGFGGSLLPEIYSYDELQDFKKEYL